jgi:hypothetical protein
VLFDESSFPFAEISDSPSSSFDFLSELDCTPLPIGTNPLAGSFGTTTPDGFMPQVVASGARVFPTSVSPPGVDVHDQLPELVTLGTVVATAWSGVALACTSLSMGAPLATSRLEHVSSSTSTLQHPGMCAGLTPPSADSVPRPVPTSSANLVPRQESPLTALVTYTPPLSSPATSSLTNPLPSKAVLVPPIDNAHGMHTRGKAGFRLPATKLNLQATALSPFPKTYWGTLIPPNWQDAMIEEFTTLQANNT